MTRRLVFGIFGTLLLAILLVTAFTVVAIDTTTRGTPAAAALGESAVVCDSQQRCEEIDMAWLRFSQRAGFSHAEQVWAPDSQVWMDWDELLETEQEEWAISECSSSLSTQISDLRGPPSISARTINQILQEAESPAAGSGRYFIQYGREYNIDPAFALAFFRKESRYGTSGVAARTRGIGNIKYTSTALPDYSYTAGPANPGPWSAYNSWETSIRGWYHYVVNSRHYFSQGRYTLEEIIPIYCPSTECDVHGYIADVQQFVQDYRQRERQICGGEAIPETPSRPTTSQAAISPVAIPPVPASGFRFAVVSDYHEGDSRRGELVQAILSLNPAFVIFNGDTINSDSGSYQTDWDTFFSDIVTPLVQANIPVFPSLGNHDYESQQGRVDYYVTRWKQFFNDNTGLYSRVQNLDPLSTFPYYSFDYQERKFVILKLSSSTFDEPQQRWAQSAISPSSFVFGHYPVVKPNGLRCTATERSNCDRYPAESVHSGKEGLLQLLQNSNSLFFGGHLHYYYPTNYRGETGSEYNIPLVFVSTPKHPDNRGILRTYNNPTEQPPSFVFVDVSATTSVNALIRADAGYRLFTEADAAQYFPTADDLLAINGQDVRFTAFSIQ